MELEPEEQCLPTCQRLRRCQQIFVRLVVTKSLNTKSLGKQ